MKTAYVTGANRGIGLELAQQLFRSGYRVVAVCRQRSEALDALWAASEGRVRVESGVDVTDQLAVRGLAERLLADEVRLNLVLQNAGLLVPDDINGARMEDVERQLAVNAVAPLFGTLTLLPLLDAGSKVGLVTSRMGSIADNSSGAYYGYRMSKAALNAAAKSLSIDLAPRGIAVLVVHPGYVRTEMTGNSGQIEASEAAAGILARMEELTLERTGQFLHQNGATLPW